MTRSRLAACALIIGSFVSGCEVGSVEPLEVDELVLDTLAQFRASDDFAEINRVRYPTALGTGSFINVFATASAVPSYARIAPEVTGSGVEVPADTLIVREVLDSVGAVSTLTLMYKGPAGYNPDLGDWWFGVTDPVGNVIVENGIRQAGRLEACYGCHVPRSADDYLFGVPATNRP